MFTTFHCFFKKVNDTLPSILLSHLSLSIDADSSQNVCRSPQQKPEFASSQDFLPFKIFLGCPPLLPGREESTSDDINNEGWESVAKCLSLLFTGRVILSCIVPCVFGPGIHNKKRKLINILNYPLLCPTFSSSSLIPWDQLSNKVCTPNFCLKLSQHATHLKIYIFFYLRKKFYFRFFYFIMIWAILFNNPNLLVSI